VARQAVERERQHHLGGATRPAALLLDQLELLEKTADVEQKSGELRPGGVEGRDEPRFRANHRVGERRDPVAGGATAALRHGRDPVCRDPRGEEKDGLRRMTRMSTSQSYPGGDPCPNSVPRS
jgi:hypothetical protein